MSADAVRAALALPADSPLLAVLQGRAEIFDKTVATEAALLTPKVPGGLSLAARAGLALRVARQNESAGLEAHYEALAAASPDPAEAGRYGDPAWAGETAREKALLAYADMVTRSPRDAGPEDIEALRAAGIGEADIVRLSGLVAFLAYQMRLLAGLELLKGRAFKEGGA